jgi:uncharacterized repeat protein (TIGR02543 family)
VSWTSNKEHIATVTSNGLVTAVAEGSATITVETSDGGFTDTCAVTVTLYTVTYHGNSNTGGTVPEDGNYYDGGDQVTVLGNTGNLTNIDGETTAYYFDGWKTDPEGTAADYTADDTFSMPDENVDLYAHWTPYQAGDEGPRGGVVVYDNGSYSAGWRYIEASDNTGYEIWGPWGDSTGATSQAVGMGKTNTELIVDEYGSQYAAGWCYNFEEPGAWFLPSKEELALVYSQKEKIGVNTVCWSSSEYDSDYAWYQNFDTGQQEHVMNKDTNFEVIPIRYF